MKIASSQYNFLYGDQLHYPYSIGCLLAYLETRMTGLDILPTCVLRDQMDVHVGRVSQADVLLCSCYVWNWEITMALAAQAKVKNPNLFIVCGGPQVPDRTDGFFDKYPFVNALVHGEGEETLSGLLADWRDIRPLTGPGITTREDSRPTGSRLDDLSPLPSPYTSGMMDRLTTGTQGVKWVPSWETNRGCPYQCTFCDWGSATYTKLRQYPMDRLLSEIRWFADKQIGYIDCCDANFGILPRDMVLARTMKESKMSTGFPGAFRQSWAKNSSEKVIEIAKELKEGGLLTAVGLAVQSLDHDTLSIIKRKNLPFDRLSDLSQKFADAGLPTYTEVIRGLPGETLATFKRGLAQLAMDSHIGTFAIYHCGILPNAPLADPEYRKAHKIEGVRSPIYLAHSAATGGEDIQEYEELVIATATMPREDVLKSFLFSWAVLIGETFCLLNCVRKAFGDVGIGCESFYDLFLRVLASETGAFGREYQVVKDYAATGYAGLGWDHVDPTWGDIKWPIEEASWLRLVNTSTLEESLRGVVDAMADQSHISRIDRGIIRSQVAQLSRPSDSQLDLPTWARETIWYGKRRRRFVREAVTVS